MSIKRDKKYKRILLKLSGEELMGKEGFGIDPKVLDKMGNSVPHRKHTHQGLTPVKTLVFHLFVLVRAGGQHTNSYIE